MANSAVPSVPLELDRVRHLRLDLNALIELERAFNVPTQKLLKKILGLVEVRTFLWACLLADDPEITERRVGELVHAGNFIEVTNAVKRVVAESFPDAKVGQRPPKARRRQSTGSTSGPSGGTTSDSQAPSSGG